MLRCQGYITFCQYLEGVNCHAINALIFNSKAFLEKRGYSLQKKPLSSELFSIALHLYRTNVSYRHVFSFSLFCFYISFYIYMILCMLLLQIKPETFSEKHFIFRAIHI